MTTIIGIDPGPETWAFVAIGVPFTSVLDCAELTLAQLEKRLDGTLSAIAIEGMQPWGKKPGSVQRDQLCYEIGRLVEWCKCLAHVLGPVGVFWPAQIRVWNTGNTSAKSSQIRAAMIDRCGPPGTKKQPGPTHGLHGPHLWDALAVAIYANDHVGQDWSTLNVWTV